MDTTNDLPILKHMTAVTDPIRCRLLRVLGAQELTVSELCSALQLPQSTVSRHLKTLSDDGWVTSRRDGTSRFYSMAPADLSPGARELWSLVEDQLEQSSVVGGDDERLEAVMASRRSKAREFFSSAADKWDHLRSEMFGDQFHVHALLALLPQDWIVGDLGCGTGQVTEILAPFVRKVVAVDGSDEMLQAARKRLCGFPNVVLQQGELDALPLPSGQLDAALLVLALHYVPDPGRTLAEAARVVRLGGRILVVDMLPHENEQCSREMGHVWLGFSETQMDRFLTGAGFRECCVRPLPSRPDARGPALFAAVATRQ